MNQEKAKQIKNKKSLTLSHYISIDNLCKDLSDRTLYFSDLKESNDILEKQLFNVTDLDRKIFGLCFSKNNESIPMWSIYTKSGEDVVSKDDGVLLKIFFKENKSYDDLFVKENDEKPISREIEYCRLNSIKKAIRNKDISVLEKEKNNINNQILFIKSNFWKFEKEYRYIVCKDKTFSDDHVNIEINFNSIKQMKIIINPLSKYNGKTLRNYLSKNNVNLNLVKIECTKSKLSGNLKEDKFKK